MAWGFFEAVRGRKFQFQNLGTKCRNFKEFGTVFEQSGLNFQDYFWTVRAEFSRLFLDSPY